MTDETVGGTGITSWQWPLPAYHPWLVQSRLARARARQPAIRSWSTAQNRSCQIFDSHQLEPVLSRLQKFSPNKAPVYIRKDLPQKKAMSKLSFSIPCSNPPEVSRSSVTLPTLAWRGSQNTLRRCQTCAFPDVIKSRLMCP